MKRTFLLGGLILIAFCTNAQEEGIAPKNHIGFSARIFNNPTSPFVIMYKRQLQPAFALRLGITMTVNSQKTNFSDNVSSSKQTSSSFAPSIGVEWQKHFAEKWTFYGGADARAILAWTRSTDFIGTQSTAESLASSKGINLSPFIGLRYNIIEQLYVATEASLSLNYFETVTTNRNLLNGNESTTKFYSYSAAFQPAVGLFFFYRF